MRATHHTNDECSILGENRDLLAENGIDATGILLALRLWLIKCSNPTVWEKIDHMEAHLDKRMGTPVWKDREVNVVNVSCHKSKTITRVERSTLILFTAQSQFFYNAAINNSKVSLYIRSCTDIYIDVIIHKLFLMNI